MNRKVTKQIELDPLGLREFTACFTSTWQVLWFNFLAGIARGFGIVIGMTIVVAIALSVLNSLTELPYIGILVSMFTDFLLEKGAELNVDDFSKNLIK